MPTTDPCRICEKRRPRRYCPGVGGAICARCCGEEREVTVRCPLDCEYLREARRHERPRDLDPEDYPYPEVEVSQALLERHAPLVAHITRALATAALETGNAVDTDVREAIESMIKTLKTQESGLIYTSRPENPYAAGIQQQATESIEKFRVEVTQKMGMTTIRDSDVLAVLVFLARVGVAHDNGRVWGRAFIDSLQSAFPSAPDAEQSPLIT